MRNCWPHLRLDTNSLDAALLLVHSFSEELVGWSDYQGITRLVGIEAARGSVQRLTRSAVWSVGCRQLLLFAELTVLGPTPASERPGYAVPGAWFRTAAFLKTATSR
jgi:hypothetical protein